MNFNDRLAELYTLIEQLRKENAALQEQMTLAYNHPPLAGTVNELIGRVETQRKLISQLYGKIYDRDQTIASLRREVKTREPRKRKSSRKK